MYIFINKSLFYEKSFLSAIVYLDREHRPIINNKNKPYKDNIRSFCGFTSTHMTYYEKKIISRINIGHFSSLADTL